MKKTQDILSSSFIGKILKSKLEQYQAFPNWDQIVGEDVAKIAKPLKITRSKILHITVPDSIYAQELQFRKADLLEKLFQAGQGAIIEDIRFIVGNPQDFR